MENKKSYNVFVNGKKIGGGVGTKAELRKAAKKDYNAKGKITFKETGWNVWLGLNKKRSKK